MTLVTCSNCKTEYSKRTDTLKSWGGRCKTCESRYIVNTKIKGIRRVEWKKCKLCNKESYYIKVDLCKDCKIKNMPSKENHYKWKKDRSTLSKKQERNDMAYKEWRRLVWERDSFKCQISDTLCDKKIEAHHIVAWVVDESLRYEVSNGITLCKKHHPKKKKDVELLKNKFINIINSKIKYLGIQSSKS